MVSSASLMFSTNSDRKLKRKRCQGREVGKGLRAEKKRATDKHGKNTDKSFSLFIRVDPCSSVANAFGTTPIEPDRFPICLPRLQARGTVAASARQVLRRRSVRSRNVPAAPGRAR